MINFLKKSEVSETSSTEPEVKNTTGLFTRLKQGLAKTRAHFTTGIANLFLGKKTLDADVLNQIETLLLTADVGVETTEHLIKTLTTKLARKELTDTQAALQCLQTEMKDILRPCEQALTLATETKPYVILVVGINGSGKTTTIGKLAYYL